VTDEDDMAEVLRQQLLDTKVDPEPARNTAVHRVTSRDILQR
jgi:hypothetical protein